MDSADVFSAIICGAPYEFRKCFKTGVWGVDQVVLSDEPTPRRAMHGMEVYFGCPCAVRSGQIDMHILGVTPPIMDIDVDFCALPAVGSDHRKYRWLLRTPAFRESHGRISEG